MRSRRWKIIPASCQPKLATVRRDTPMSLQNQEPILYTAAFLNSSAMPLSMHGTILTTTGAPTHDAFRRSRAMNLALPTADRSLFLTFMTDAGGLIILANIRAFARCSALH